MAIWRGLKSFGARDFSPENSSDEGLKSHAPTKTVTRQTPLSISLSFQHLRPQKAPDAKKNHPESDTFHALRQNCRAFLISTAPAARSHVPIYQRLHILRQRTFDTDFLALPRKRQTACMQRMPRQNEPALQFRSPPGHDKIQITSLISTINFITHQREPHI